MRSGGRLLPVCAGRGTGRAPGGSGGWGEPCPPLGVSAPAPVVRGRSGRLAPASAVRERGAPREGELREGRRAAAAAVAAAFPAASWGFWGPPLPLSGLPGLASGSGARRGPPDVPLPGPPPGTPRRPRLVLPPRGRAGSGADGQGISSAAPPRGPAEERSQPSAEPGSAAGERGRGSGPPPGLWGRRGGDGGTRPARWRSWGEAHGKGSGSRLRLPVPSGSGVSSQGDLRALPGGCCGSGAPR